MSTLYVNSASTATPSFSIRYTENPDTPESLGKEFKSDIQRITRQQNRESIWIRQNGEEIYKVDMNDNHVINALRMCKRNMQDPLRQSEGFEFLLLEAIHRGIIKRNAGEWDEEENVL